MLRRFFLSLLILSVVGVTGCSVRIEQTLANNAGNEVATDEATGRAEDVSASSTEDTAEKETSEEDIVPLRSAVASSEGLGEDAIVGTCLGGPGLNDALLMALVEKHFNAVTIENELKPDSMFGNNNDHLPKGSLHEEELNGVSIFVPTMDHTHADAILDAILEHNEKDPDNPIRVRGHVLVWHSQTPEWFFHTDYDKSKDYVTPEEMNARLEWYIKSMFEYYTGPDSRYRDLFYGWDVVNEAISDRTGTYRTDTENSSWWKVYQSNEYIINAFRFANMYAPAGCDLYYNDYNECNPKKCKGIIALIKDVKAAEGTRIDGFGMQEHNAVNSPTAEAIDECARAYAEVVHKIMITELDVKKSMFFRGGEEELPEEYERQAVYYRKIYEVAKNLRKDGIDFAGITFWGTVDKYSWIWKDGTQFPLLFDSDYNPKPAYRAFVDPNF